ncbi:MAG: hypothetical protein ACP5LF_00275 [Nitrososphaeria archaeon]|nr:hypothetical protein [Conexivisphaerales archaeon]
MSTELKERLSMIKMLGALNSIKAQFTKDKTDFKFDYIKMNGPKEGEIIDIGLWLAPTLAERGLIKVGLEDFEAEVFNAINKEKILGQHQLGPLPQDFYQKFNLYVRLKKDDQKIKMYVYDLIKMRINKIIQMAFQGIELDKLMTLLTPEETVLYEKVKNDLEDWYSSVFSDG